jgi:hypothetical protein
MWTDTVFGNAPAKSYRSGCHDATTGPQIDSTATFSASTSSNGFTDFDTIEVY